MARNLGRTAAPVRPRCCTDLFVAEESVSDRLRAAAPGIGFVYLEISPEEALRRVAARAGDHFFPAGLVDSQFATLESPVGEAGVLTLDGTLSLPELKALALAWINKGEKDE